MDFRRTIALVEGAITESSASHPDFERGVEYAVERTLERWNDTETWGEWEEDEGNSDIVMAFKRQRIRPDSSKAYPLMFKMMHERAKAHIEGLGWQGNKLTIYRNINVAPGWELDPEHASSERGGIGIYWSTDGRFALTVRNASHAQYTLKSEITADQVDWFYTIASFLRYDENEIRAADHVRLPILDIAVNGQTGTLDLSHLKGKRFDVGSAADNEDWSD